MIFNKLINFSKNQSLKRSPLREWEKILNLFLENNLVSDLRTLLELRKLHNSSTSLRMNIYGVSIEKQKMFQSCSKNSYQKISSPSGKRNKRKNVSNKSLSTLLPAKLTKSNNLKVTSKLLDSILISIFKHNSLTWSNSRLNNMKNKNNSLSILWMLKVLSSGIKSITMLLLLKSSMKFKPNLVKKT